MSKVIFITGASSGIGKSIGEFLLSKDYVVYGSSRNPERYPDSKIPLLTLDVRNLESINKVVALLLAKTDKIDVLINNAGVGITGALEEIPLEQLKNNFETNLFGPIELIKAFLPTMRAQKSGLIINITSVAGYMGLPYRSAYSASKGALELITEALRMEVKPFNIQVTNVAPGDFATNIAAGRFHTPVLENSPYRQKYEATLKMMDAHVDSGSNPDDMAVKILQILETKKVKIHYKVGAPIQKLSIVLKRILPDLWYEKLVMNHYKL